MKLSAFALVLLLSFNAHSQLNPVKWTFSAVKTADKTYELHLKATVQSPWHIYSQTTPEGGPLPTTLTFNKNPLVTIQGAAKEVGSIKEKYEEVFDIKVKYFNGNAEFVQVIKLKSNVKTSITGKVEFMACNDEQCMPPDEVPFAISID